MKSLCVTGESARDAGLFARLLAAFRAASPDYLEVRDREASDSALLALLTSARQALPQTRVLSHARFDLALAAGAAGVVLPEAGLPLHLVRRETPRGFLIGQETESADRALEAIEGGADLVLIGPIVASPADPEPRPVVAPESLLRLPPGGIGRSEVFAIGGLNLENASLLDSFRGRIAGLAAARLFENSGDPAAVVEAVRSL